MKNSFQLSLRKLLPFLLIIAGGLGFDILTKYLATKHLQTIHEIVLIDGVFALSYVENRGAAFSMLSGKVSLLIVITSVITIAAASLLLYSVFNDIGIEKRLKGKINPDWSMNIAVALIIGGSIGNLLDRITLGYVVDFLYFSLINFPVFNFADCFVVIGGILAAISILFKNDEDSLKETDI